MEDIAAIHTNPPDAMRITTAADLDSRITGELRDAGPAEHPEHDLRWLPVLSEGLGHEPLLLEIVRQGATVGRLPLAYVRSRLFGRFLVSLPYVSSSGIQSNEAGAAAQLIEEAVHQASQRDCSYLALRHEQEWAHGSLTSEFTSKVHMRLDLPATEAELWQRLKASVRNQVRKGQKEALQLRWGGAELLDDFYTVFSRNMRDLGTPVYSSKLFAAILRWFGSRAELCTITQGTRCIAGALLIHGGCVTIVPSASSLRKYNRTNANMLLYWNLLVRAIKQGQQTFDFGRSTRDSGVYRFKKQWGAKPHPACWQYHVRYGMHESTRPESRRNQRLIRIWRRLPVGLTRLIGPVVVRGIP